jgi:DNA-binding transcriptional LysR family regulator
MHKPRATDFALDIAADLHKWRSFVAIGELGSLTRAALFLDSNQSFLSRQVNALERECGTRLFNRTGRGVELSEAGSACSPSEGAAGTRAGAGARHPRRPARAGRHRHSGQPAFHQHHPHRPPVRRVRSCTA